MKANEAPEKIYLNWVNYPLEEMQVEYTRTDAFIDKACELLKKNRKNYSSNALGGEYLIDDFKKAMKGE